MRRLAARCHLARPATARIAGASLVVPAVLREEEPAAAASRTGDANEGGVRRPDCSSAMMMGPAHSRVDGACFWRPAALPPTTSGGTVRRPRRESLLASRCRAGILALVLKGKARLMPRVSQHSLPCVSRGIDGGLAGRPNEPTTGLHSAPQPMDPEPQGPSRSQGALRVVPVTQSSGRDRVPPPAVARRRFLRRPCSESNHKPVTLR